ncbi:hypothetical protein BOC41_22750 [Burkholderia pseudomallei]|uniref:alcohol dehydrogenase catalytic domain-containing protein n=1 Tax=Burkholderia pseudomallei TaxID=28450 RepID=UPI000A1A1365|nr:zinc-binding dehydrogenase [Burkholderia pseudomallei]ARL05077.1 hypothetical protein BOC44_25815 [Burkholderia pseudomallei]OSP90870.1 hypothetical protein BOC41_22750 [Burkholderia pseudomallei]
MSERYTAALLHTYSEPPAQFSYVELARPALRAHEIEVAVTAASINPLDLLMADGYGRRMFGLSPGARLPLQLGRDGSGIVTRVGAGVRHLRPGMSVWFALPPFKRGTYATHIQFDGSLAREYPAELSPFQAASLPYAGITALRLLEAAQLDETRSRGRRVFIHGASGGIGLVLLDLLHAWGASVCVSASPAVFDALSARARCTCFDSRGDEMLRGIAENDTLLNLVASGQADLSDEQRLMEMLPHGGRYAPPVTPVPRLLDESGFIVGLARSGLYRYRALRVAARRRIDYRWVFFKASATKLDELTTSIQRGKLSPLPISAFAFEDLSAAHAVACRSPRLGKVVVGMPPLDPASARDK